MAAGTASLSSFLSSIPSSVPGGAFFESLSSVSNKSSSMTSALSRVKAAIVTLNTFSTSLIPNTTTTILTGTTTVTVRVNATSSSILASSTISPEIGNRGVKGTPNWLVADDIVTAIACSMGLVLFLVALYYYHQNKRLVNPPPSPKSPHGAAAPQSWRNTTISFSSSPPRTSHAGNPVSPLPEPNVFELASLSSNESLTTTLADEDAVAENYAGGDGDLGAMSMSGDWSPVASGSQRPSKVPGKRGSGREDVFWKGN